MESKSFHEIVKSTIESRDTKVRFDDPYLGKLSKDTKGVIQKRMVLAGGESGSGKSTLVDQVYVLSPLLQVFNSNATNSKLEADIEEINYWSLELAVDIKLLKWLAYYMWISSGTYISTDQLDGTEELKPKAAETLYNYIKGTKVKLFLDFLQEKVKFQTSLNVDTIQFNKPVTGSKLIIDLIDHLDLIKGKGDERRNIDALCKKLVANRNNNGRTEIIVQQFNRTNLAVDRQKFNPIPQRDDFKSASSAYEASDIVLGIINPLNTGRSDFLGADLTKFKLPEYRRIHVLKNRYGRAPLGSSVGMLGRSGWLFDLPTTNGTDIDYECINDLAKLKELRVKTQ